MEREDAVGACSYLREGFARWGTWVEKSFTKKSGQGMLGVVVDMRNKGVCERVNSDFLSQRGEMRREKTILGWVFAAGLISLARRLGGLSFPKRPCWALPVDVDNNTVI